ncbi:MAG TPA: glycosyltransferase [Puia sp.]|nr:glycosyltransferase [Puia sp.]
MTIILYITLVLLLGYGILIGYYRSAWVRIPYWDDALWKERNPSTNITVVVPARNEEKNIEACIESVLRQSYPGDLLEIIVVNDHSTDATAERVQHFNNPRVRLLNLEDHIACSTLQAPKKKAIELAVGQSRGELIVTTDADCRAPASWIAALESCYVQNHAAFIAAPVRIVERGGLLSVFQSLDFITLQGITGAAVYKKIFAMCNGANLAYQKTAFREVDGFRGIDAIASGDDMLLMYKISKKFPGKTFFAKTRAAIVNTEPAADWKQFMQQRIRWSSKADKYQDKNIFWTLLFVYVLNCLLLLILLGSFWNSMWFLYFVLLVLLKTLFEFSFVKCVADFFEQGRLMKYFLFLQPLHILYIVTAGFLGKFAGYRWKDRPSGSQS